MRVGVHSPARFFVSLPFNILGCLSVRSQRQKSRRATARAQSPKNLYAATHLSSAQQSRVRSEHVRKELGRVLATPIIFGRFLVGLYPDNAIAFLDKLKVEDLWLVGHKTALELHSLGIFKVRQLRNQSLSTLSRLFGKRGQLFYDYARGIDDSPVEARNDRKSVSCESTFAQDLSLKSNVIIELYHITLELVNRLDKSDFSGHTLTLKVKYADFTQVTRSLTCATPLTSKDTILPLAKKLLQKVEINASHPIRLMGLGVSLGDDKPQNKLLSKSKQEEPQLPFAEY